MQEAVGAAWSFVPFIVVLAGCIVFLGLFLPETRGRHIHDIVRSFSRKDYASLNGGQLGGLCRFYGLGSRF